MKIKFLRVFLGLLCINLQVSIVHAACLMRVARNMGQVHAPVLGIPAANKFSLTFSQRPMLRNPFRFTHNFSNSAKDTASNQLQKIKSSRQEHQQRYTVKSDVSAAFFALGVSVYVAHSVYSSFNLDIHEYIAKNDHKGIRRHVQRDKMCLQRPDIRSGQTPLFAAIAQGNKETITLLLDLGANIHATDFFGYTPLVYALDIKRVDIVELLLNRGANANDIARSPLLFLAVEADHKGNQIARVEYLAQWKANLETLHFDYDYNCYFTPLLYAVRHGKIEMVRALIKNGARINALSSSHWSALHLATNKGDAHMVRVLLEAGIDANLQPSPGYTAHYVAQWHYENEKKKRWGSYPEKYERVLAILNEFKQKTEISKDEAQKKLQAIKKNEEQSVQPNLPIAKQSLFKRIFG